MNYFTPKLFVFMLIFSLISAGAIKSCQNLKLDAVWSEGVTADLFITPDHEWEAGYTLVLTWDREVTVQQWVGEISSEDNRVNKQDSIKAGQMFSVRLLITFPTSPNPPNLLSATLDGQDVCIRELTATTMPSTMSSTTTMLSTPKTTVSNMMGQDCGIFKIDAEWDSGITGDLFLTSSYDGSPFNIEVTFDQPLEKLEQWTGDSSSDDQKTWTIINTDGLTTGNVLSLRMLLRFSVKPNLIAAKFNGIDLCSGVGSTIQSTTQSTTHSTTHSTEGPSTMPSTTTMLSTPKTTASNMIGQDCGIFKIDAEWDSGITGDLLLTSFYDGSPFNIEVTFDQPLEKLEQWTGESSSDDQKTWTIINTDGLTTGNVLSLRMLLRFSVKPNLIAAKFNGRDLCSGGGSTIQSTTHSTTESTTQSTTHSTTQSTESTSKSTAQSTTRSTTKSTTTQATTQPTTQSTTPMSSSTQTPGDGQGFKPNYPAKYEYGEVLNLSLLFYEAQRSGKLPADNRVPWRGDSALDDEVIGGYYDAGDLVKFGFPMAATITVLAWGGVSFKGGYDSAGLTHRHTEALKWGTDYFIGCHLSDYEFIGQIGDGDDDHAQWESPENNKVRRPVYKITKDAPGSDLAGETAAALAASAIWFRMVGEEEYADMCLEHAKALFKFADEYRGKYTDAITDAGTFYQSWSGYKDELIWAAAWIAKATGDQADVDKAETLWRDLGGQYTNPSEVSWDDKWAMTYLMLYDVTGKDQYKSKAESFVDYLLKLPNTDKGLVWISSSSWGSLRYAGNFAMYAMQAGHLGIKPEQAFEFAEGQINYALGDAGQSYVCGFGANPPKRPHHRGASCPGLGQTCGWEYYNRNSDNIHDLKGALVGGPNRQDQWVDDRTNFNTNEVTTDYNAGFQSAIAGLKRAFD